LIPILRGFFALLVALAVAVATGGTTEATAEGVAEGAADFTVDASGFAMFGIFGIGPGFVPGRAPAVFVPMAAVSAVIAPVGVAAVVAGVVGSGALVVSVAGPPTIPVAGGDVPFDLFFTTTPTPMPMPATMRKPTMPSVATIDLGLSVIADVETPWVVIAATPPPVVPPGELTGDATDAASAEEGIALGG